MDRRNFLKHTGWSLVGMAASGSLLSACQQGTAAGKKVMPSASNLKYFWGDLHNHCNITYGHGDMRSAFEAAKEQLDFVSVTPHAMWPDIPGADDPRLKWVIDYHTGAFKRLREGGYEKYVAMTNEYNKEGEFLAFVGYEAHSMEHGDHVALNYDLDAPLVECCFFEPRFLPSRSRCSKTTVSALYSTAVSAINCAVFTAISLLTPSAYAQRFGTRLEPWCCARLI